MQRTRFEILKKSLLPFGLAIAFIALGFILEVLPALQPVKNELQKKSVATSSLGMNTFREQARTLGLFEIVPNSEADYSLDPKRAEENKGRSLPFRRARHGAVSYSIRGSLKRDEYPSVTVLPKEAIQSPLPMLSIAADNGDLFDPRSGILTNPFEKGKRWERPAFVSYFDEGKLQFSSGVGIRVHGGKSRGLPFKSFRLRFRKLFGVDSVDGNYFFSKFPGKLKSFVLQSDKRYSHSLAQYGHFMSPFAYQLTRDIGGLSPETKPLRFYLNGIDQGVYVVTERVDEGFLKNHFGHKNFTLGTEKYEPGEKRVRHGPMAPYKEISRWATKRRPPLFSEVAKRIDLESLSLSIISTLYTATTDGCQAYFAKDLSSPENRWFWINWDMDHAFIDIYRSAKAQWKHPTMSALLNQCGRIRGVFRVYLFRNLKRHSPEFRKYFRELFADVMNHRLRPKLLEERANYYAQLGDQFALRHTRHQAIFRRFVRYRHPEMFKQVAGHFSEGQVFHIQIKNPQQKEILIDGHSWSSDYEGGYFPEMTLRLQAGKGEKISLRYGQTRKDLQGEEDLKIPITGDLVLEVE